MITMKRVNFIHYCPDQPQPCQCYADLQQWEWKVTPSVEVALASDSFSEDWLSDEDSIHDT